MTSIVNDYKKKSSLGLIEDPLRKTAGLTSSLQVVDTTVGTDIWPIDGTSANELYQFIPEVSEIRVMHTTKIDFKDALKFTMKKNIKILEKLAKL